MQEGGGTHVIGLSVLNQEVDEDDGDEKADGLEVLRARNRIKSQSGATQGIFSLIDRGPYLEVKLISPESNESQRSEYRDASHVQRISQSEGKTGPKLTVNSRPKAQPTKQRIGMTPTAICCVTRSNKSVLHS